MKSNRKVLLITGCIVLIVLIASLGAMRNIASQFFSKTAAESNYKGVPVTDFERLDFSANWNVRIWQGSEFKVEVANENSVRKHNLENIDGTLYFKVLPDDSIENSQPIYAKIITPSLKGIKAKRGTKISLESFQSDSIELILEDGNAFKGYNNHFRYILFKTSGDVSLQLTDDGNIIQ
ncbi:MAG TPA: DUF2807 domain-containing protein [Cyclobacteriaceae bacterium]